MSTPTAPSVRRAAERERGLQLAGALAPYLDAVADQLHGVESLHLHDVTSDVGDCGYCYLRAGRTLGAMSDVMRAELARVDLGGYQRGRQEALLEAQGIAERFTARATASAIEDRRRAGERL